MITIDPETKKLFALSVENNRNTAVQSLHNILFRKIIHHYFCQGNYSLL